MSKDQIARELVTQQRIAELEARLEDAELIAWGLANNIIEDERLDFNRAAIIDFIEDDREDEYDEEYFPWHLMVEDDDGGYTGNPEWRMKSLNGIPVLTPAAREALRKARKESDK